ncbi:MAG: hypothetical protein IMF12_01640 [Proteobacteria bacterium]|nr:hypothetical protein [Pseudomonadota bacterium]
MLLSRTCIFVLIISFSSVITDGITKVITDDITKYDTFDYQILAAKTDPRRQVNPKRKGDANAEKKGDKGKEKKDKKNRHSVES